MTDTSIVPEAAASRASRDTDRSLDTYRLLGRSGLRVSPLALGAMTFGEDWGWTAGAEEARRIFDAYVDRGGNFIDTANQYTNGSSERLVGAFAEGRREQLVARWQRLLPGFDNRGVRR